ncbi:enoyl-CoA hydratase [Sphingomonas sp. Root710]|uniref:enoyl-CoA hydratase n=1 Tax=Sphingomonas sp. Root710 TaxID=1736594 RepID=UPI0006F22E7C|nr:enoyl-CoA hydratase [Sphingomonas sp. Root710]KRB86742.1 enoyl-CoA hydratase [Sphingomonas sp. Root710]
MDVTTGTDHLLATLDGAVLTLTLNRPQSRNAMSDEMLEALAEQLARAEVSPDVRSIVLTGAGRGFCAGGDVKAMADPQAGAAPDMSIDEKIHLQRIIQRQTAGRLFHMPKPTIAFINGAAAGAGLVLALSCDLRVMSTDAFLMTAFANVGVSGDFGGTYFMTRLVGAAMARELYYLSERVAADRALQLGLTNWSIEPDTAASFTMEIAHRLANGPSVSYRYMKENLNRAISGEADDCLDIEATHHVHCMATADHREATSAFVEKRKPIFVGA